VFGPDAEDPVGIDLYTSGFAPYEGVQLFFPAAMYTYGAEFPWVRATHTHTSLT
jgi:hypothetical protein